MVMATDDHYMIISADCHAGANQFASGVPTVGEIGQPLTELPDQPNEALLLGRRRAS